MNVVEIYHIIVESDSSRQDNVKIDSRENGIRGPRDVVKLEVNYANMLIIPGCCRNRPYYGAK